MFIPKQVLITVHVVSLPDDRTARARIRDEALRFLAERGPDAVTVRDIAAASAVSPTLVAHYPSKDGLRSADNDLAVVILRDRLREVLGTDPLSDAGLRRCGGEVMAIYRGGLAAPADPEVGSSATSSVAMRSRERP